MEHGGERRRRKGKGQLSLSSTLSCFMCPSVAAPLVLACRVTKKRLTQRLVGLLKLALVEEDSNAIYILKVLMWIELTASHDNKNHNTFWDNFYLLNTSCVI